MEDFEVAGERSEEAPRPAARPDALLAAIMWARVAVGLVLAATGGVALGHALTSGERAVWLWVGGITLVTGVLLAISGFHAGAHAAQPLREQAPAEPETKGPEPLVPLLGALLVYKYRLVSHQQLMRALEEQRKTRKLLGEIMVDLGMITRSQLREALQHQRLVLEEKRGRLQG